MILSEPQFVSWYKRLALSLAAVQVIRGIRSSEPARRVGSGAGNVSGNYPSAKMGSSRQFESRTIELPAIWVMERDQSVVEYYDQPPAIKLQYDSSNGRRLTVNHVADFFVMTTEGAHWVEWKPAATLAELAERYPNRYVRQGNGWRCPPGEAVASALGLGYRVRSDADINPVLVRNLRFLERYARDFDPADSVVDAALAGVVAGDPGITVTDLLLAAEGLLPTLVDGANPLPQPGAVADVLYLAIVQGTLYVDLDKVLLDQPSKAPVFLDAADAIAHPRPPSGSLSGFGWGPVIPAVGETLHWLGAEFKVVNVGTDRLALLPLADAGGDTAVVELAAGQYEDLVARGSIRAAARPGREPSGPNQRLVSASPKDHAVALGRWESIKPVVNGEAQSSSLTRTGKRWLSAFRAEDEISGYGLVALLPRPRPGNRSNHGVGVTDDVLAPMIEDLFSKPSQSSLANVIRRIRGQLASQGVTRLPSARRIRKLEHDHRTYGRTLRRKGFRGAYASKPFVTLLSAATPPHGKRPWERVHIDHTLLDLEVVDDEDPTIVLGRPWLTVLIDAFSRTVLAVWLSFDDPSYRTNMNILRICARRHDRMPETIVSDRGADFESVYYESLLAMMRITKESRPPMQPRFGSVIERFFGSNDALFIHELTGNTKATKNVRTMTPAVDPKHLASWDLESLYEAMCMWVYEIYPHRPLVSLGTTPAGAYSRGIALAGARAIRPLPPGDDFAALFLPTSRKGTLKNRRHRGLRFNNTSYRHDLLDDPRLDGVSVPFRFDPWDVRRINAYIDGQWRECLTRAFDGLGPLSERALAIASERRRGMRRQSHLANASWDTEHGDFLADLAQHGELRDQLRKDAAVRKVAIAAGILPASGGDRIVSVDRPETNPISSEPTGAKPPKIVELPDF